MKAAAVNDKERERERERMKKVLTISQELGGRRGIIFSCGSEYLRGKADMTGYIRARRDASIAIRLHTKKRKKMGVIKIYNNKKSKWCTYRTLMCVSLEVCEKSNSINPQCFSNNSTTSIMYSVTQYIWLGIVYYYCFDARELVSLSFFMYVPAVSNKTFSRIPNFCFC
jgi:hypothetical protein